jgi:BNR repeat-like domain
MKLDRRKFMIASSAVAFTPWTFAVETPTSPITNRWGTAATTILDLDEVCVFRGHPGAAYNHHHQILFHNGRLYASWSNGFSDEDHPGQHMVFATSDDDGKTWSTERTITPPLPEKTSTYTAMGIREYQSKLIAYYGHYAYTDLGLDRNGMPAGNGLEDDLRFDPLEWVHKDIYTDLRISTDKGETWGTPTRVLDKFVPNLRPFPIRSGRLIMTGNITFPFTDDPAGLSGWQSVGLPRLPIWIADDPEGFHKGCAFRHDPRLYCEASFYQTDDGVIHMLMRTLPIPPETHDGLLAVTESSDDGKTWLEPRLTSYTDCSCRFHFGRLPDGRFFGLSCPNPKGSRTPLVLALSKDGIAFDRHYILGESLASRPRMPGMAKGGAYGYPTCDIAGGKMYIIYSRGKEDIFFMKLDLKMLS